MQAPRQTQRGKGAGGGELLTPFPPQGERDPDWPGLEHSLQGIPLPPGT